MSLDILNLLLGEGTASLRVPVLPSVVEHLYDELDGVSDLMSPDHCRHKQSLNSIHTCTSM